MSALETSIAQAIKRYTNILFSLLTYYNFDIRHWPSIVTKIVWRLTCTSNV